MKANLLLLILLCCTCITLSAQDYEAEYEKRIKREYLYGTYIPKDLADAMVQLNRLSSPDSRQKFKAATEEDASRKLHFSLGRWIMRNWGFYGGSRLSHYLRKMGLSHPDDMARFIIIMWHRNLNKQPLDPKPLLEELIQARQAAWENQVKRDTLSRRKREVQNDR